jgi:Lrp/AsnC family leucine-responsive transcriptional regulator
MESDRTALDRAERDILRTLQTDGRVSNVDLAERVGLSESPCFRRVRRLEDNGVISGYAALLDQRKLGLQVTAFVQISLDKQDDSLLRKFLASVEAEQFIIECHAMSGGHDYLLKVVAYSMDHFSELSMERILKFPGVKNIESNFSLKEIKHSLALPLP